MWSLSYGLAHESCLHEQSPSLQRILQYAAHTDRPRVQRSNTDLVFQGRNLKLLEAIWIMIMYCKIWHAQCQPLALCKRHISSSRSASPRLCNRIGYRPSDVSSLPTTREVEAVTPSQQSRGDVQMHPMFACDIMREIKENC